MKLFAWTTSSRVPSTTLNVCTQTRPLNFCATISPFPCTSKLTKSTTWPALRRRSNTSTIRCRPTKTSVHGAINMFGLAKRLKCRILQASTSEVYGDPAVHPQTENYWGHVNPIGPRSCYDEGKRCAETLFFDYHRQHNLQIKVARIFNTYGPRMHRADGRVVSNFIVQALLGRDITVYGEGLQTRSFCYVDDLIDGLVRLMDTPPGITGPVNIGNPTEFKIIELAEMVLGMVGSHSRMVRRPLPENDPKQRQPDISLAQELLGWRPRVQLKDGLLNTIAYFDRLLSDNVLRAQLVGEPTVQPA